MYLLSLRFTGPQVGSICILGTPVLKLRVSKGPRHLDLEKHTVELLYIGAPQNLCHQRLQCFVIRRCLLLLPLGFEPRVTVTGKISSHRTARPLRVLALGAGACSRAFADAASSPVRVQVPSISPKTQKTFQM